MEQVLYEYTPSLGGFLPVIIQLILGIAFFTCFKWYPLQNPGCKDKTAPGHTWYSIFKWLGWIAGAMFFVASVSLTFTTVSEYSSLRDIMANDDYLIVEGTVENYHAMPASGNGSESFRIKDIHFDYSDYEDNLGYHTPASNGGVITHNGQRLKIKYIEDDYGYKTILYIAEFK